MSERPSRRRDRSFSRFEKARGFDSGGQPSDVSVEGRSRSLGTAFQPFGISGAQKRAFHPLETALLIVVAAHLVFLPWMLGAVRLSGQIPSLILSVISLILALWPRRVTVGGPEVPRSRDPEGRISGSSLDLRTSEHPDLSSHSRTARLLPYPRLLRFPIFWVGLALLALIVVQGLNPAWEYQTNGKLWWMRRIPYITWLPHGVKDVPFNPVPLLPQGGEWRMLLIYTPAWLTACAIWVGFTRRRTLQRLFIVLAVNGVALSLFGIAQRMLGWTEIFDFVPSTNPWFFASFIYKNHAGGYLVLMVAIATGLGAWYYVRSARRLEKSSPAGLFGFLVTCIAVAIVLSYARGATFTMLGYLCVVVVAFLWFQIRLPKVARSPVITIAMLILFALFVRTGLAALHSGLAWDRLRLAVSGTDTNVEHRIIATRASSRMLSDSVWLGVGSGAFPFLFPLYQQHYPEIAKRQFWPHAHNDVLEIPIDLGLPGVLLIAAGFAFWAVRLARAYAWDNPLTSATLTGAVALIGMSWGEFVFFCPAILTTWCALWPACTRWAELEEQRGA